MIDLSPMGVPMATTPSDPALTAYDEISALLGSNTPDKAGRLDAILDRAEAAGVRGNADVHDLGPLAPAAAHLITHHLSAVTP